MTQYRPVLGNIPPVVKNLIIINVLVFAATWILGQSGIDLTDYLGLHNLQSDKFMLHQIFTHMFMHGSLTHIFFNMFALWMFGRVLESVWGPKRFLMYYLITGIGAAALHTLVNYLDISSLQRAVEGFMNTPSADQFYSFVVKHKKEMEGFIYTGSNYNLYDNAIQLANQWLDKPDVLEFQNRAGELMSGFVTGKMNIATVGASGAVFGILLAFGMLFPNTQLMLLFPPIPIKAKYFVIGYGVIELYLGLTQPGSNIAHFAHLGGMLFGFILIKYWNKNTKNFY
ncbi:MAG: rhomboid family intramembrane serine protease [Prolixibacteraceae bacterium]|nr:rhomboid family intramembrane serine protease [Prolixibacteraceae bacterium]MBN2775088.1 rhomboid family intramembrane serine protease [Prolixibacteraceae bacterium]